MSIDWPQEPFAINWFDIIYVRVWMWNNHNDFLIFVVVLDLVVTFWVMLQQDGVTFEDI